VPHVLLTREAIVLWQPGGGGETQSFDATFGRARAQPTAGGCKLAGADTEADEMEEHLRGLGYLE